MAGASEEHAGDTGIREPSGLTGYTERSADGRPGEGGPDADAPPVYRPLSLLAILALVLGVLYGLTVVIGGLIPFARAYPRSFVLLLLLGPVGGVIGAVLTRQKGAERVAAVAALALAAVVVFIGLGGLVAFSSTSPWMLGGWTWLLLGAAVLVSVISLSRIRTAEGALAGRELARWGLWLSLFFGGYYLLYVAGNLVAVTTQAETTADRFVADIAEGKMHEAFQQTLKPGNRPELGAGLQKEIETVFDQPRGSTQPGEYTHFRHSDFVQRIRLGGGKLPQRKSASSNYSTTGYSATVSYDLTNDLGRFEIEVKVLSVETAGKRLWYVPANACRVTKMFEQSDRGRRIEQAVHESQSMLSGWLGDLRAGKQERAYLMTLPPAQREPIQGLFWLRQPEATAWAGLTPRAVVAGRARDLAALERGANDFRAGKILDDTRFQPGDPRRDEMIGAVRDILAGKSKTFAEINALSAQVPDVIDKDGEVEVVRPVRVMVMEPHGQQPRFVIDSEVVIRGTVSVETTADRRYRIASLRLLRLVSLAADPAPPPPGPPPD